MLLVGKEFRNQRFPDCTLSPSIPPSAFGEALIKRFFAYKEFFPQHLWGKQNAAKRRKNIKFQVYWQPETGVLKPVLSA